MTLKFKWETEFKETEIGKIPKDWDIKSIGQIRLHPKSQRKLR